LVKNPAWFQSHEGSGKIVSPTPKGLIHTSRLGQPFHEHLEQIAIAKGPASERYSWCKRRSNSLITSASGELRAGGASDPLAQEGWGILTDAADHPLLYAAAQQPRPAPRSPGSKVPADA
jgi:hypothetical protein